jgi:bacterioferritin-associated ferredoxin
MVDENVVDSDDNDRTIARRVLLLKQVEATLTQHLHVPDDFSEPVIEAGLVGRLSKVAVNAIDRFVLSNVELGRVFGKVVSCGFCLEQVAVLLRQFLHNSRSLEDHLHWSPQVKPFPNPFYPVSYHNWI